MLLKSGAVFKQRFAFTGIKMSQKWKIQLDLCKDNWAPLKPGFETYSGQTQYVHMMGNLRSLLIGGEADGSDINAQPIVRGIRIFLAELYRAYAVWLSRYWQVPLPLDQAGGVVPLSAHPSFEEGQVYERLRRSCLQKIRVPTAERTEQWREEVVRTLMDLSWTMGTPPDWTPEMDDDSLERRLTFAMAAHTRLGQESTVPQDLVEPIGRHIPYDYKANSSFLVARMHERAMQP